MPRRGTQTPWLLALAGLSALAIPAAASAAPGDQPPRIWLELGSREHHRSIAQGEWWGPAPALPDNCGLIAIDPAPGLPRAFEVPSRPRRFRVIFRTPHEPELVRISKYAPGNRSSRRAETYARRRDGRRVWAAFFRANVRTRLDVDVFAGWQDENGCGPEWIESLFRLRAR